MIKLILILLLGTIAQFGFSQVDNYQKNKEMMEAEELLYQKALVAHPNSAKPHWEHANRMAEFTTMAYKNAWKFYKKALEIDSTNVNIYEDYGDYLLHKYKSINDAKYIYNKGLSYSVDNKSLIKKIKSINETIDKRNEEYRLRSFGTSTIKQFKHNYSYSQITDWDSLKLMTQDKEGDYYYPNQLETFLNDKPLNDYEIYLLLIGYSQTVDYNPYNYNDIENLHKITQRENYHEAIKKGHELLKVNPLNPSIYRELMYCYRQKGDEEIALKYQKRIQNIFNAMIYTGNGSCTKPYVTFWVKEEYNFAKYFDLSPTGQYSTTSCGGGMADKLEVYNPETEFKEFIHFNIMPIFKKTMKK